MARGFSLGPRVEGRAARQPMQAMEQRANSRSLKRDPYVVVGVRLRIPNRMTPLSCRDSLLLAWSV